MKRLLAAIALVAALGPAAGVAGAACADPKTSVTDISDEVMCIACGVPLNLAEENALAERQRAQIQRLVDECKSKDEVKDALVADFGQRVLAEPDDEGFDLAATIVPVLAVLLGLGGVTFVALRWRRNRGDGDGGTATATPLGTADSARLDADIDRYEL